MIEVNIKMLSCYPSGMLIMIEVTSTVNENVSNDESYY